MLCENCKSASATTHIKKTVNGVTKEFYLCPNCASKLGFSNFDFFDVDDFWGSFFENKARVSKNLKRCKTCNASFDEIVKLGKMGCPDCYVEFKDEILPSLVKIHGNIEHKGFSPDSVKKFDSKFDEIKKLQEELKVAIQNEEFEKAAEIRDAIKVRKEELDG